MDYKVITEQILKIITLFNSIDIPDISNIQDDDCTVKVESNDIEIRFDYNSYNTFYKDKILYYKDNKIISIKNKHPSNFYSLDLGYYNRFGDTILLYNNDSTGYITEYEQQTSTTSINFAMNYIEFTFPTTEEECECKLFQLSTTSTNINIDSLHIGWYLHTVVDTSNTILRIFNSDKTHQYYHELLDELNSMLERQNGH